MKKNKKNIEEDIEILKGIEQEAISASLCSLSNPSENDEWRKEAQAIENVLSELETYKKIIDRISTMTIVLDKEEDAIKGNFIVNLVKQEIENGEIKE